MALVLSFFFTVAAAMLYALYTKGFNIQKKASFNQRALLLLQIGVYGCRPLFFKLGPFLLTSMDVAYAKKYYCFVFSGLLGYGTSFELSTMLEQFRFQGISNIFL